ncbi:hypothetical protein BX666DRAFT_276176 [Dichotomocladium elegans]|nr:hypothetical protein BX666DRAFT_276176 [Dichotomocladium elegans]
MGFLPRLLLLPVLHLLRTLLLRYKQHPLLPGKLRVLLQGHQPFHYPIQSRANKTCEVLQEVNKPVKSEFKSKVVVRRSSPPPMKQNADEDDDLPVVSNHPPNERPQLMTQTLMMLFSRPLPCRKRSISKKSVKVHKESGKCRMDPSSLARQSAHITETYAMQPIYIISIPLHPPNQ